MIPDWKMDYFLFYLMIVYSKEFNQILFVDFILQINNNMNDKKYE